MLKDQTPYKDHSPISSNEFPFLALNWVSYITSPNKEQFFNPSHHLSNTQKNWMKYSPIQLLLISIHTSLTIYYFEPYQIMSPNYCFKYNFFQSRKFMFFCIIPLQSKMLGKSKSI